MSLDTTDIPRDDARVLYRYGWPLVEVRISQLGGRPSLTFYTWHPDRTRAECVLGQHDCGLEWRHSRW